MSSEYQGELTESQQERVLEEQRKGTAVRRINEAVGEGVTYGQVRYFLDWVQKNPRKTYPASLKKALPEHHMKVLVYDIETAPLLAHVWHTFGDYVAQDQLITDTFMLTWAAKWYHDDNIMADRLTSEETLEQNDDRIVASLSALIREADIVIAHNGDKFDLPNVNTRLMMLDQEPLGPTKTIDTLKLSKKFFKHAKHSLDYLAEKLLNERKKDTDFMLWRKAYQGDEEALRYMDEYCQYDVALLERIFDKMKPYVQRLPRFVNGPDWNCPYCGSTDLQKRGYHRTQVSTFQRWQCQECGKYSRSKSLKSKRHPLHPL